MALYDGTNIFGFAVKMMMVENPTAEQLNAFFGLHGLQAIFGGLRGRTFTVDGVFFGVYVAALNASRALWFSYVDGIARDLVDQYGDTWPQVLVKPFQPANRVLYDARGYYLPYRGVLVGL